MQIGLITVDGRTVGVVSMNAEEYADPFMPDLDGYVPQGRAAEAPLGAHGSEGYHGAPAHGAHHAGPHGQQGAPHAPPHHDSIRYGRQHGQNAPKGETYQSSVRGSPVHQGSAETDQAIVDAARAHHLDTNTMRGIASIESSMNPSSNANRPTQYKGLYQIGRNEWDRFGAGGNIYSAHDNAMGAARMFDANRGQFRQHFNRDPTDTELYMMHQQGLGFYTRGAMTNIGGNPYPGMHGAQTHESFEAGWGRELAHRKAGFAGAPQASAKPVFDPDTQAP